MFYDVTYLFILWLLLKAMRASVFKLLGACLSRPSQGNLPRNLRLSISLAVCDIILRLQKPTHTLPRRQ